MRAEDVPEELVEVAARAMWNAQTRQPWQQIEDGDEWPSWVDLATRDRLREKVRPALAAVLPQYEATLHAAALTEAADELERQMRDAGEGGSLANHGSIHRRVLNFLRYRAASVKSVAARLRAAETERTS